MSQVKFIGCLHLGHGWMAEHRKFKSVDHYHEHLIKQWNSTVHKKDLVYILGDVTMEKSEFYPILDKLNGRKKVVLGNHDRGKDIPELLKYVETVEGMVHYKGYWLTHCPVHPQELTHVRGNIHAHVHEMKVPEVTLTSTYWDLKRTITSQSGDRYYNVDAENINYTPLTIEEILQTLKTK